jgi:LPS sulfotransferase NodH
MSDLPISYIICATPRCGSHLLAEALSTTSIAGKPDEYFHSNKYGQLQNEAGNIAEIYGKKSLEEFRELVWEFGSSKNGVFGIILHWNYLHHVIKNYQSLPQYQAMNAAELFDALFSNPKYIWIQRRDKVLQAISWIKAAHTGVWSQPKDAAEASSTKELLYDYYRIDLHYNFFVEWEKAWLDFFASHKIEPFIVVYEDLVENYEQTQLELLNFLEIPYDDTMTFAKRKLQKQGDRINEVWAKKYRRQKASQSHRIWRYLRYLRFKLFQPRKTDNP